MRFRAPDAGTSRRRGVIASILAGTLEATARRAFAASGGGLFFLLNRPLALVFMVFPVAVVVIVSRGNQEAVPQVGSRSGHAGRSRGYHGLSQYRRGGAQ